MPARTAPATVPAIIERLNATYPDARYELNWENPLQLLVATILAAQCTDERVNQVTPALFAKYRDARAFAEARREELEEVVRPTGFYRKKAQAIQEVCRALVERFGGEVPRTMDEMVTLPGVARKTANVVLNTAFRIPSGIIVDTHVARVSPRLGLTEETKPERIERDLMALVPKAEWVQFGPAMVLHGRYTCTAHAPQCPKCVLNDLCPKRGVDVAAVAAAPPPAEVAPAVEARKAPAKTSVSGLAAQFPEPWRKVLAGEFEKPYFQELQKFVAAERQAHTIFPPEEDVFNAFRYTPYDKVKVLLLGQDPYHDDGQAHGLCFSVRPGVKPPPSLVNIFKELHNDLGCTVPDNGCLTPWAEQGIMLLNAVLTVRAHEPASHKDRGWERFTDAVIRTLSDRPEPVVFVLWGAYAQKKQQLIDAGRHRIIASAHPSPLSAKKFFGSRPFSQVNRALKELGQTPIDWQLPNLGAATPRQKKPAGSSTPKANAASEDDGPGEPAPVPPAVPPDPRAVVVHRALSYLHSLRTCRLLPADWQAALGREFDQPYFRKLEAFVDAQRLTGGVCPAEDEVFRAFQLTPYRRVRVVLVGDEPPAYGDADGLAFSRRLWHTRPPELHGIFEALHADLGCWIPSTCSLVPWAEQGILLLNTVLTVTAGWPGSHRDKGWERFTDAVLRALSARTEPVVFALWGEAAHAKRRLLDEQRHPVLTAPHPTAPGFIGRKPFSAINKALQSDLRWRAEKTLSRSPIYWQLFAG
jgi:uracil-DNA glycosylase